MASNNPLLDGKTASGHIPWTAMDYHRRAIENGNGKLAALWFAEARKRGEVIDPSEVRT